MRIVLVDPSRTVQMHVTRTLQQRAHEVVAFCDPAAALDRIKSDPEVGVLITSFELVSMSGSELCRRTRAVAQRRPIYIVLMSSSHDREHLVSALDSGADDFVGKPPEPEELYARLRAAQRVVEMQRELIRLADTDPLTGMLNRRAFFELGASACGRSHPAHRVSAVMFDIDHFKRINDTFGHEAGDKVIVQVARVAAEEGGVVGRLGGEEFAVILEAHDLTQAFAAAERMRLRVLELRPRPDIAVSCSYGVSECQSGDSVDDLLRRADVGLYAAKTGGRNRVVASNTGVLEAHAEAGTGLVRAAQR